MLSTAINRQISIVISLPAAGRIERQLPDSLGLYPWPQLYNRWRPAGHKHPLEFYWFLTALRKRIYYCTVETKNVVIESIHNETTLLYGCCRQVVWDNIGASTEVQIENGSRVLTPWEYLDWQIGGNDAYALVEQRWWAQFPAIIFNLGGVSETSKQERSNVAQWVTLARLTATEQVNAALEDDS